MYINIISAGVLYWSGGQVTIETVSVPGNIRKYKLVSKRRRAMKLKSNLKCHKCHLAYLSIFKKKKNAFLTTLFIFCIFELTSGK